MVKNYQPMLQNIKMSDHVDIFTPETNESSLYWKMKSQGTDRQTDRHD